MTDTKATEGRIVVGVDSSRGSSAALDWAVEEARRRGARLHVVSAWELPQRSGLRYRFRPGSLPRRWRMPLLRKSARGPG